MYKMKKLTFDEFADLMVGGPSRRIVDGTIPGCTYILVTNEYGDEVFYAEWVDGDDGEMAKEAYEAYLDGESEYLV
jgi:hypothetical protein